MLPDIRPSQGGANGFTHGDDCFFACRGKIIANVQLDTIHHRSPAPAVRLILIVGDRQVRAGGEGWRKRASDPAFEGVSGDIPHLVLDSVEALALALPDLDREELKQVAIVVRRCRASSLGVIEQPAGNVEAH
jgi:hypothetical protein